MKLSLMVFAPAYLLTSAFLNSMICLIKPTGNGLLPDAGVSDLVIL
ncbi:hypothetical protein [Mucilaginibacter myungsuensis]|uniref:Uncharacterized protein n=1 Tax=Mucilaginibacter myungsuensis TaxID=649104 RepID=A0A929PYJ0_9SPHI|nr:hypothetical protein [Mucilaginibacter myungsuensis]MBE9664219.1 hypothetical protein [Mucilaginibacter myungsuensis]MDN3599921.1 hypothetical protein [Mucilaginibacter myungsuensis]